MHGLEGLGNIVDTENVSSELQSPVMKDLCCREGFFGSDVEMPVYHALAGDSHEDSSVSAH